MESRFTVGLASVRFNGSPAKALRVLASAAQQAVLGDTRPTPGPLHDLTASATRFAVWDFAAQGYDTVRFVRHSIPSNAHPSGWGKFLRLWVEEREVHSGRVDVTTLDSLALDFSTNLPWAMARLVWRAGAPPHAALDSTQGVDLLLLDIRDGYDSATDSTWIAGFMDRCDTKTWTPDGCPWRGGGNQANILYLDAYPQLGKDPAWPGLMSGWLYGRRVSSTFGPRKLLTVEHGVAKAGRGAFSTRWEFQRHPQLCTDLRQDSRVRALELAATPPHPERAELSLLQDRGGLFVDFLFTLDGHFERVIDRVDENGERIRCPPIYQFILWFSWSSRQNTDLVVIRQFLKRCVDLRYVAPVGRRHGGLHVVRNQHARRAT